MKFEQEKYYHLYNRSNNREDVFREVMNYPYFLKQYSNRVSKYFDTVAYCLMPTNFHFLVKTKNDLEKLNRAIGIWLSAYTKAVNKRYNRQGGLFQPHTKAKEIKDENYLITLITYIHQNPIRAGLVDSCGKWEFSSYREYVGKRDDAIIDKSMLVHHFRDPIHYASYSEELLTNIRKEYWI